MSVKSILLKVVLPLVVVCLVLLAACAVNRDSHWIHYSAYGLNASKDAQLIAIFQRHRAAFEKIQEMATEDAQRGWYFNSPDFLGAKLTTSRSQKYKDLVSSIRAGLTVYTDYDSSIRFILAGGGTLAIGPGWAKGIEYVPGSRESDGAIYANSEIKGISYQQQWKGVVRTNLDNAQTLPVNVYLRPIESNWFLFYQRTD